MKRLPKQLVITSDFQERFSLWSDATPAELKQKKLHDKELITVDNKITNLQIINFEASNSGKINVRLTGILGSNEFNLFVSIEYFQSHILNASTIENGVIEGEFMLSYDKLSSKILKVDSDEYYRYKYIYNETEHKKAVIEEKREKQTKREKTKEFAKNLEIGQKVNEYLPHCDRTRELIYLGHKFASYDAKRGDGFTAKKGYLFAEINNDSIRSRFTIHIFDDLENMSFSETEIELAQVEEIVNMYQLGTLQQFINECFGPANSANRTYLDMQKHYAYQSIQNNVITYLSIADKKKDSLAKISELNEKAINYK